MNRHGSMNRFFRLVWSEALLAWVPAAENTRGGRKTARARLSCVVRAAGTASLSLLFAPWVEAAPTTGRVVAGTASITQSGSTTDIHQTSEDLSINWQSFNIAPQETVNFLQPSASSVAVNRIFGVNGSQILGHLNANGQVFLINPNGVLFGRGATVNVGGLVASTLDMNDAGFIASAKSFNGTSAAGIVNQGTITAATGGYVALLGGQVANQGVITARLGTIALGAGSAVTLTFSDHSLVSLNVDRSILKSMAENGGLLQADGGRVLMTAGAKDALMASVVNNTGVVDARTVESRDGTIVLLGQGGASEVDVAGTLDAGGTTHAEGGGRIETSAAQVTVADGAKVTTAGAHGLFGSWLVDPHDFTVARSGGDISGATLSAELATTSVTLQSSKGGKSGAGDVNIDDGVSWSANTGLTLTASNDVNVNQTITATGATASLTINPNTANGTATASGAGTFNLGSGAAINLPNVSASSATALVIGGSSYTVINRLGAPGSTTGTDLQGINGNLTNHYALGSNIDASATATWNPLGTSPQTYAGFAPIRIAPYTFDGLGHTISNLSIYRPTTNGVGLFAGTRGIIRNVGLIGGSVTGGSGVGALVGSGGYIISNTYATTRVSGVSDVGGLIGFDDATLIVNSHATGAVTGTGYDVGGLIGYGFLDTLTNTYATGNVTGGAQTGGLVGFAQSTIVNSHATGRVSGTTDVGGLVGMARGDLDGMVAISNSYATGAVSGTMQVGGLVGGSTGAYGVAISNSYATGNVNGTSMVGGLVGFSGYDTESNYATTPTVTNSYASGNVSGTTSVGGLVGMNYGSVTGSHATGRVDGTNEVGGLVGYNFSGDGLIMSTLGVLGAITNSYATGSVTGTSDVGGLAGLSQGVNAGSAGPNGVIANSYATGAVRGSTNVGGLIGMAGQYGNSTTNSYATGNVTGATNVGGLIGRNAGELSPPDHGYGQAGQVTASYATGNVQGNANVGGLIGSNSAPVAETYSLGPVTGSQNVGGLIGAQIADDAGHLSAVTNSYWNSDRAGPKSAAGTGLSSLQMQDTANFTGFMFTKTPGATGNNWVMVDADGTLNNAGGVAGGVYPMLASEYSTNITNSHQLQLMAMNAAAHYTLAQNVSALSTAAGDDVWGALGFVSIGVTGSGFTGSFDGQGHDVADLTINAVNEENVGLFGKTAAGSLVQNLGLIDVNVNALQLVGPLAGINSGTIINSYATGTANGMANLGGLVGENRGTMSNDYASTAVRTGPATGVPIGRAAGGLVGWNAAGTIEDSYATGSVASSNTVGGLVGFNGQGATVTLDYAGGHVSGASAVGGLVGVDGAGGMVSNSYWNTTTSGVSTSSGGGTGLTTAQMQTASNFIGFHFTKTPGLLGNNWVIVDVDGSLNNAGGAAGATSPLLASEYSTSIDNGHRLQLADMNLAANYTLQRNLDLAPTEAGGDVWGSAGFVPIGSNVSPFRGQFDGGGYLISNVTISQPTATDVGLFGHISVGGGVRDLGLVGGTVSGLQTVGALVGLNSGVVSESFATSDVDGRNNVGGLAGVSVGSIDNSYATGSVDGDTSVGGLVGYTTGTLIDNYSAGRVTGAAAGSTGGLVGAHGAAATAGGNFWDVTTSGQSRSALGRGLTTAQMQTHANFTSATPANGGINPDWDFMTTWFQPPGSYPLLLSFQQ